MLNAIGVVWCKVRRSVRLKHRWVTVRRVTPSSESLLGKATEDRRTMWLLKGLEPNWEVTSDTRLANGMICFWCREHWLWDEATVEDYKNWLLDN